jgi:NAD(P)-dependent dehydrogenase (short-subunit alcohol dehydrogenase family)
LEDRVAIVTGCEVGHGGPTTLRVAGEGTAVAALDIGRAESDTTSESPGRITPFQADVPVTDDVQAVSTQVERRFARLEALGDRAGAPERPARMVDLPKAGWDRVVDVDMKGAFVGMKSDTRAMTEAGHRGAVVDRPSIKGPQSPSMLASPPAYGATKTRKPERGVTTHAAAARWVCIYEASL